VGSLERRTGLRAYAQCPIDAQWAAWYNGCERGLMMDNLGVYDTKQLEDELARRKREAEEGAKPKPIESPDWTGVQATCESYVEALFRRGYVDSDDKQWIFEAAMEAVFGKDVWPWVNSRH
jgi:hypothetical protein